MKVEISLYNDSYAEQKIELFNVKKNSLKARFGLPSNQIFKDCEIIVSSNEGQIKISYSEFMNNFALATFDAKISVENLNERLIEVKFFRDYFNLKIISKTAKLVETKIDPFFGILFNLLPQEIIKINLDIKVDPIIF